MRVSKLLRIALAGTALLTWIAASDVAALTDGIYVKPWGKAAHYDTRAGLFAPAAYGGRPEQQFRYNSADAHPRAAGNPSTWLPVRGSAAGDQLAFAARGSDPDQQWRFAV